MLQHQIQSSAADLETEHRSGPLRCILWLSTNACIYISSCYLTARGLCNDAPLHPTIRCVTSASHPHAPTKSGSLLLTCPPAWCSPYTDGNAVFNYIFMVIFFVDSCLSFRVAIIENDILITDSREIAKNYLRLVLFFCPFFASQVM